MCENGSEQTKPSKERLIGGFTEEEVLTAVREHIARIDERLAKNPPTPEQKARSRARNRLREQRHKVHLDVIKRDSLDYQELGNDCDALYEKLLGMIRLHASNSGKETDALEVICSDPKLHSLCQTVIDGTITARASMSTSLASLCVLPTCPTRPRFDINKVLDPVLNSDCGLYFNSPVTIVAPIVTHNCGFIIDGNHRWAQLFSVNPFSTITAIDITTRGTVVPVVRNINKLNGKTFEALPDGFPDMPSVYGLSYEGIREYIDQGIQSVCVESVCKHTYCENKDDVCEYIADNMTLIFDVLAIKTWYEALY